MTESRKTPECDPRDREAPRANSEEWIKAVMLRLYEAPPDIMGDPGHAPSVLERGPICHSSFAIRAQNQIQPVEIARMKTSINAACLTVAVVLLAACAPEEKADPAIDAMLAAAKSQDQMLAAVSTWVEAWDSGNSDTLDAITAPNFKRTAPDQNADGLDELKALITQVHKVYPDFRITNDAMAAGPDGAFVQWTVTGTDSGSEGATGNSIAVTGISRYQFSDGMIASELVIFDTGELLRQLRRDDIPHGER